MGEGLGQVLGRDGGAEPLPTHLLCCSLSRSSTNELAVLISRMQTNADQVEKDILETQSRLKQVTRGRGWWEVKGFA